MLDGSTMVTIPTHVSPLQTAIISTGPTADCSRHVVCRPGLQLGPQTTAIASMPLPGTTLKSKMRPGTEDPCQLAPLKKRKIQVSINTYGIKIKFLQSCIFKACNTQTLAQALVCICYSSILVIMHYVLCFLQLETLSPDQRDRVVHKREKNKVAAEKCRVKRREKNHEIRMQYEEYLVANEELESQIRKLREEYRDLQELVDNHPCVLQTACSRT